MRFSVLLSLVCALPAAGQGFDLNLKVKQTPAPAAPPVQVRQVPVSSCPNGGCIPVTTYRLVPVSVAPVVIAEPAPVLVTAPRLVVAAPAPLYEVRYGFFGRPRLVRMR